MHGMVIKVALASALRPILKLRIMRNGRGDVARLTEDDPMSDVTPTAFDMRKMLADIDLSRAETQKFIAERDKLLAEAAKFNRDRFLAPALALAATLGAIATIAPAIVRAVGGHG